MGKWAVAASLCACVACGGDDASGMGWDPADAGTSGLGSADTTETPGVQTGDDGTTEPNGAETEPVDDDGGGDSTGAPEAFDCAPQWETPFVGSPCGSDGDCSFDGGKCLREDEGFPCGTCSAPCESLCEDLEGAPTTYCIDGSDVMLEAEGFCLSKCDPGLLGGNGCRDGYACRVLERFADSGSSSGVCVPTDLVDGEAETACQEALLELGAVFAPRDSFTESPDGHPNLICEIEDPVLLYGPLNGVGLRYVASETDSPVLVGCATAVSLMGSAAVAQMLGADEIIHLGAYNCRVISGTSTLSEHGTGRAIDIGGFTLETGEEVSVYDDWEDGNPTPSTPHGQMLRAFTDQVWMMSLWNIILTPEFNAAHDDHFHIDLTPGGNTYD